MDNGIDYENACFYKKGDAKFVRALKAIMFAKNLNQLQLANLLGVRQSQISKWLNGKSQPSYFSMQMLKSKLNVCIEHFFD